MNIENISIILVEPESPGNIGSVARAMKTTGFTKLRLVNPCQTDTAEVRMMAHRSLEIVQNAYCFKSLKEALWDIDIAVGTTMRKRQIKIPYFTPEQVAEEARSFDYDVKLALVFGREKNGLYNNELALCQLHSTIPIATENPALNLAQAVMIYCYQMYCHLQVEKGEYKYKPASHEAIEKLYDHLETALVNAKFKPRDDMATFILRFRRLLGRTIPEFRDLQMLHKIIQILAKEKQI
jgi:TrmH family RNA methyltransferase